MPWSSVSVTSCFSLSITWLFLFPRKWKREGIWVSLNFAITHSDVTGGGGGGMGGQSVPRDFWLGNFCWPNREREERKMEQKIWKIKKLKVENIKWKEEKLQNEEGTLFCLFVFGLFFVFCFFFFAFHFSKPLKFVWGLPKWEFSAGKNHFMPGKKIRKKDFAPSEKYSSYAPGHTWRGLIVEGNCF